MLPIFLIHSRHDTGFDVRIGRFEDPLLLWLFESRCFHHSRSVVAEGRSACLSFLLRTIYPSSKLCSAIRVLLLLDHFIAVLCTKSIVASLPKTSSSMSEGMPQLKQSDLTFRNSLEFPDARDRAMVQRLLPRAHCYLRGRSYSSRACQELPNPVWIERSCRIVTRVADYKRVYLLKALGIHPPSSDITISSCSNSAEVV